MEQTTVGEPYIRFQGISWNSFFILLHKLRQFIKWKKLEKSHCFLADCDSMQYNWKLMTNFNKNAKRKLSTFQNWNTFLF